MRLAMPEAVHNTQNDFWRPPVAAQHAQVIIPEVSPSMVEACDRCETEFMVGARFCYLCGAVRRAQASSSLTHRWARYLEFSYIKEILGLTVASLAALLLGLGCLLAAAFVGAIYAVQNSADFQAIQFWRMEWLLAAIAFFVAGVLLKQTATPTK
jgi:hypothetical protein